MDFQAHLDNLSRRYCKAEAELDRLREKIMRPGFLDKAPKAIIDNTWERYSQALDIYLNAMRAYADFGIRCADAVLEAKAALG